MAADRHCPDCGAELIGEATAAGLCPECLMRLGLTDRATRSRPLRDDPSPGRLPGSIGRYSVLSKLGEGGMGVVYEAEQQSPRRRVAVKVVRGGEFVDDHRVRSFQREAETLARLKHPDIGAIYESGCTEDGQHFFAMELVRGETLGAYLAKRPQAVGPQELRMRLSLFRRIADAVQYAHQRGVIHRDLKPSNIIVTGERTSEATSVSGIRLPGIKILDFGLARITEGDVAAATMTTEIGVIKGTLAYMSPEQTRGSPEEIDVRTDVYALGVILYEMLTGSHPYEVHKKSLVEAVRVICEEGPRPLRQTWSGVHRLDPDVETIIGKALEKEADRRYASAAALSDDIERFLHSQPILARPPSTTYQLRKLVARNKLSTGFAATLLVLLLGFGVWMSVLYRRSEANLQRALEAEQEASIEADTASRVSGFLVGLFEVSDPGEARGNSVTAREILDKGAVKVQNELRDQPEIQARMMQTMGNVYRGLGLYDQARRLLEQALETRRGLSNGDDQQTMRLLNDLAKLEWKRGRHDDAERLLLEAREGQLRLLGADHPDTLDSTLGLDTLYIEQGRYDEAESSIRQALVARRRLPEDDGPGLAATVHNLGFLYWRLGRNDEAEPLFSEAVEIRRRVLGDDHPDTLTSLNNLALVYIDLDRGVEAEPLLVEALEKRRRVLGSDHEETLSSLNNLAIYYDKRGRYDRAEELYLETLEVLRRVMGEDFIGTVVTQGNIGNLYTRQGRLEEAVPFLAEALRAARRSLPPVHPITGVSLRKYGECLTKLQRYTEAETLLLEAHESFLAARGEEHPQARKVIPNLVELYDAWGKPDEAAVWRAKLP